MMTPTWVESVHVNISSQLDLTHCCPYVDLSLSDYACNPTADKASHQQFRSPDQDDTIPCQLCSVSDTTVHEMKYMGVEFLLWAFKKAVTTRKPLPQFFIIALTALSI